MLAEGLCSENNLDSILMTEMFRKKNVRFKYRTILMEIKTEFIDALLLET